MSVEEPTVDRQGVLEITTYGRSQRFVKLVECPFCGHQFDDSEPRWKHYLDEHGTEVIPGNGGDSA